jgi:putative PIN family toxin of toxin-antitoxin system
MKIFFDSNAYIAEALLGGAAEEMIAATISARWRVYSSAHLLDEVERVLVEKLGLSQRFARLTCDRILRRSSLVTPPASRHVVPQDPADSPILKAALAAGVDLLVTNDRHLLALNPY